MNETSSLDSSPFSNEFYYNFNVDLKFHLLLVFMNMFKNPVNIEFTLNI